MKLLLTSGGVTNESIRAALVDLLGKPVEESDALCVPTAGYGNANEGTLTRAWRFVTGSSPSPMTGLGWRSVGLLELTALPSVGREAWEPWVRAADVLLVDGGDAPYLCRWMRETGLADLLPSLRDLVWVGVSAGSMVMTPRIGEDFLRSPGDDRTLGVVDFSIFPHLDNPELPENTLPAAEKWAADLGAEAYAIDEQTAIRVVDGAVDVVSEGSWRHFPAPSG